jgi:hypothetical protein
MGQDAKPPAWRSTLVFFAKTATLVCLGLFAIQFVWDQIDRHRHGPDVPPLPPIENYKPTAENDAKLRQFVHDVLIFTLLHETGHLVFKQYNVPIGSEDTNESAADSFAATIMMTEVQSGSNKQYNGLISAAYFWQAFGTYRQMESRQQQVATNGSADLDPHQDFKRRAVKLACLLFGTNPDAFAGLAGEFHIETQRDQCINDADETRKAWRSVILVNLDPDAGKVIDFSAPHVAVFYKAVPEGLPNGATADLSHGRQLAQDLGILDIVGKDLLSLKAPPDSIVPLTRHLSDKNEQQMPIQLGKIDMAPLEIGPHVEHPQNDASDMDFDYRVIGDNCLDSNNQPVENAYWDSGSRAILLCYAWVNRVEYIGKRLLAEPH